MAIASNQQHTPQSLAKQFCNGQFVHITDARLWQQTFEYVLQIADATAFQRQKILQLWLQYGGDLRARTKNDALILAVLHKTLPRYQGDGLTLYRGESWWLFEQQQIGFCWTPDEQLARKYAQRINAIESGGILLKAFAPTEAILAGNAQPDKNSWICDPSRLLRMTTLGYFPQP